MRFLQILFLISFVIVILLPAYCPAAFKSAKDPVDTATAFNPQPLDDDIVLPMPCSLSMVLRPVEIPSGALIRDKTFLMGIANSQDIDRQIYERQFTGHIAAPFTTDNLPDKWQTGIGNKGKSTDTWYFIGKYEVSRMQWDSVMRALNDSGEENQAACPRFQKDGRLPIAGVSWFDVQEFLHKYNAWLVKNHPSSLPVFPGTQNTAFLRLPTEEEWEYAARGGALVPPEWWADKDFYPLEEGKEIKDYGVFNQGTTLSGPAPIGSRNANPLGIHDTAGNLREMIDGFFRLSVADMRNGHVERRLHGAAGGIIGKGGSFRSMEADVLPGRRDETALYTVAGPGKSGDLGFRLVLAALNIPDASRLDRLREEEKSVPLPNSSGQIAITTHSPLEALDTIAQNTDGTLRANLLKLRAIIEDRENAQASLDSKKLEHSFRSLLYQAETLRAFAYRYAEATKSRKEIQEVLDKKNLDAADRTSAKKVAAMLDGDLSDYLLSLQMGANYYKTSLAAIAEEPEDTIARLIDQARKEYGGKGVFNHHMLQNLDILEKFLEMVQTRGIAALNQKTLLKDIIPEQHFKILPL